MLQESMLDAQAKIGQLKEVQGTVNQNRVDGVAPLQFEKAQTIPELMELNRALNNEVYAYLLRCQLSSFSTSEVIVEKLNAILC